MHAKLPVQRLGIITDNIKPTAFHRAFWSECTDDHMSSVPNRTGDLADVSDTVACRGKKMKDSAVVPHIVNGGLQFDPTDVRDKPMHTFRSRPPNRCRFASMAV